MVLVVLQDGQENRVVARFEAWDSNCMVKATNFIADNGYVITHDEVDMNGDWVLWVE